MSETIPILSPLVGRIVPPGERRPVRPWLVDGLLQRGGLTALAVARRTDRTAVGVMALQALMNGSPSTLLGQPTRGRVERALVFVTALNNQDAYRSVEDSERLTVVLVEPHSEGAPNFWSELNAFASQWLADLVVVDTVQDMGDRGAITALERFDCAVLALMQGNETKAGVGGGEAQWSAADIQLWIDPKTQTMHPVGGTSLTETWPVTIEPAVATSNVSDEQRRVIETAELASRVGTNADAGRATHQLRETHAEGLAAIWGDITRADLLPAIGRHKPAWDAAFAGRSIPNSDTPPF